MKSSDKTKSLIGRAEKVTFPKLGATVHARIDTGAKTSSIWASSIRETAAGLAVVFFGTDEPAYTGEEVVFGSYHQTIVASSNGQAERRFVVRLPVTIANRRIQASFTLADRSTQVYPVLVGRNVLRGKFVVDVSLGSPLTEKEKARKATLMKQTGAE